MTAADETTRRATIAHAGAIISGMVDAIRAASDEEMAAIELATISQPGLLPVLTLEARRRAAVIEEIHKTTPWSGTFSTPLAAGLRSVAADVARGWLP